MLIFLMPSANLLDGLIAYYSLDGNVNETSGTTEMGQHMVHP